MYHSITFYDNSGFSTEKAPDSHGSGLYSPTNTTDDWKIVPMTRPVVPPPGVKTITTDIPGANGYLDFTESLCGIPFFNNRTGSIEFMVLNDFREWNEAYEDIMATLHGKKVKFVLEDEPEYYYEGRTTVNAWDSSDQHWSHVTIDYDVKPFKKSVSLSTDDWLWDPFNFETGVITQSLFDMDINAIESDPIVIPDDDNIYKLYPFGQEAIMPTFKVSDSTDGLYISLSNPEMGITTEYVKFTNGSTKSYDFILSQINPKNRPQLKIYGTGKLQIEFRKGML